MTDHRDALQVALENLRDAADLPPGLFYRNAADFVLRHGDWYEPAPLPPGVRPGLPRLCFGNAIANCIRFHDWLYVEGFALTPEGLPFHHAWNLDAGNMLRDTTWQNRGLAYLGVVFALGRADDATWNGDASVLDDRHRGFPLFRQPWRGEDWNRVWPPSEALILARKRLGRNGT